MIFFDFAWSIGNCEWDGHLFALHLYHLLSNHLCLGIRFGHILDPSGDHCVRWKGDALQVGHSSIYFSPVSING
jgi:hypothetical protein